MTILNIPASHPAKSFRARSSSSKPGRQHQGQLWSNLKAIYELLRLPGSALRKEDMLFQHVQYKAGQRIYTGGQRFDAFHIINCGFVKIISINELNSEQVLGFPMRGDLLGLEAIDTGVYASEAIALSDCDLILMPFKKLCALGRTHIELQDFLFEIISRELSREREIICMLGGLGAEARVARFLLSLANRFAAMGYSDKLFNLRMTRQEIGSYLGITLETVSRTLTSFKKLGLITVSRRAIGIKDPDALRNLRRLQPSRPRARSTNNSRPQTGVAHRNATQGSWSMCD